MEIGYLELPTTHNESPNNSFKINENERTWANFWATFFCGDGDVLFFVL